MSYLQDYLDSLNGGVPGGSLAKLNDQYQGGVLQTKPNWVGGGWLPGGGVNADPLATGGTGGGIVPALAGGVATGPLGPGSTGTAPLLSNGMAMPKVGQANTEQAAQIGANPADAWKFFYQGW